MDLSVRQELRIDSLFRRAGLRRANVESRYFPAEAQHRRSEARAHALQGAGQVADLVARAYTLPTDRGFKVTHGDLVGDFS